jgi:hypothetical protein
MSRIFEVQLNDGQDESTDSKLLPAGKFRSLINCRLRRDGRIEPRPTYTALATTGAAGASITPYDLATFGDRLVAFATGVFGTGPAQPYSYVDLPQFEWCVHGSDTLPALTDLEQIWSAPSGVSYTNCDVAYSNGFVAVARTHVGTHIAYIDVIDLASGVVIVSTSFTAALGARVAGCGNSLILVVLNTSNQLVAREFTTTADTAFGSPTTLTSNVTAGRAWDLVNLEGTSDYLVAYANSSTGSLHTRRYNTSHSQQWENTQSTIQASVAVCGATGENVTLAWNIPASTNVVARSMTAAGGVNVSAATTVFTGNCTDTQPRVLRASSTQVHIAAVGSLTDYDRDLHYALCTTATMATAATWDQSNVRMTSKLLAHPNETGALRGVAALGPTIQGGSLGTGSLTDPQLGATIFAVQNDRTHAKFNSGFAGPMNEGVSTAPRVGAPSVATNGAGTYWALVDVLPDALLGDVDASTTGVLRLMQFKIRSTEPRSWAECQGALYIAGGFLGHFDGFGIVNCGYEDAPVIFSATEGSSGSLTQLATYNYVAVYEWYDRLGRVHRSAPSSPFSFTLTSTNDELTVSVSTPRSMRRATDSGDSVTVVLYRAGPNDGTFFQVNRAQSTSAYAASVAINDRMADGVADAQPVLYTQSQTPDAHFAPEPCKFIAAGRDRLILGGLPDPYAVELSKLPFPGEPIQFGSPNAFKFQARLNEPVTAVAAMGDTYLAFTNEGIYEIPGNGPQRNGQGEFNYPRELYSDGGCINHLSLCQCAEGLWFQEAPDKLSLFNGQSVTWAGAPVRDTLASFPSIVAAVLCTENQTVNFACNNLQGTDGVLLSYDLRRKVWTKDLTGKIETAVEYNGRLAYIQSGAVYLQGAAAVISNYAMRVETGSFRLWSAMGTGDVLKIGVLGTFLGDCSVEAFISHDDGASWDSMGSQTLSTADRTSGDPLELVFIPRVQFCSRFALRVDVSNVATSFAVRLHAFSIEAESEEFTTRRPARDSR